MNNQGEMEEALRNVDITQIYRKILNKKYNQEPNSYERAYCDIIIGIMKELRLLNEDYVSGDFIMMSVG